MRYGSFKYNEKTYLFELEDDKMTIVNIEGIDIKQLFLSWNTKDTYSKEMRFLKVKFFPNGNNGIIFHQDLLEYIDGKSVIDIIGYIEFEDKECDINEMSIAFDELSSYYNLNNGIDNVRVTENGEWAFEIKNFDKIEKKKITLDNQAIQYWYSLDKKYNSGKTNILEINASVIFSFVNSIKDYSLICKLIKIFYVYYSYINERQNIQMTEASLFSRVEGIKRKVGTYYNVRKQDINLDILISTDEINKHIIKYDNIKNIEGKLIQQIIDNNIFVRHIPRNHIERNQISDGRFLSVTAAFEWEFDQIFDIKSIHSESKNKKAAELSEMLDELGKSCNSWQRRILKNTKDHMLDVSLEEKIKRVDKEFELFSKPILEQLLNINVVKDENSIFSEVNTLRNDFAHGHIHIDYDSDGILGIIYLERIIYVMQLKRMGLEDVNIMKCINSLFTHIYDI